MFEGVLIGLITAAIIALITWIFKKSWLRETFLHSAIVITAYSASSFLPGFLFGFFYYIDDRPYSTDSNLSERVEFGLFTGLIALGIVGVLVSSLAFGFRGFLASVVGVLIVFTAYGFAFA